MDDRIQMAIREAFSHLTTDIKPVDPTKPIVISNCNFTDWERRVIAAVKKAVGTNRRKPAE